MLYERAPRGLPVAPLTAMSFVLTDGAAAALLVGDAAGAIAVHDEEAAFESVRPAGPTCT